MTTKITLHEGDNRDHLRRLIDQGVRVHSVVTDPPYGLTSVVKRFGKEGAAPAKFGSDGAFSRASGGFMGKCFHPDTEIMTSGGWRRVTDVQIGDTVATLNPETRELEWQSVEQTHAYQFEGELVHVKHRSAEQMVTPNHRIVVSHDGGNSLELVEPMQTKAHFHLFAQAQPVAGIEGDPIVISSEREYGRDGTIVQDTAMFNARAFFRFFGLWLGDGYTCTRTDDHPANDFFGFAVKKERKIFAIRQALLDLKIKFTETPGVEGENTNFYCYDFALLGFLNPLGKAADKYIPTWMFDRDASELEELYLGLMETDGCHQGKDQEVYYTTSRQLAEDFQRLCLHTGRSAISIFRQGCEPVNICGNETVSSNSWALCVLQPGKRMYGERSNRRSNVIFEESYAGFVYCVGVPKHHILYTRFNGKPVWSGNSWDGTGIERDPEFWRLIWEILLPGGFVFAFSGSRTGHWQACAMEMAGFIMHPMHGWVYGSGMPKAHNPCPTIDKIVGAEGGREVTGDPVRRIRPGADQNRSGTWEKLEDRVYEPGRYVSGSPEAAAWDGWRYGTQTQKPALEPLYLGQKPYSEKTGAANLLKHGVGALNIDGCRVGLDGGTTRSHQADYPKTEDGREDRSERWARTGHDIVEIAKGRWPANLLHDGSEEVVALFPSQSGAAAPVHKRNADKFRNAYGAFKGNVDEAGSTFHADSGSAARFFHSFPLSEDDYAAAIAVGIIDDVPSQLDPIRYQGKAGKADRAGSKHPTVKPIALMEYCVRHLTPPGGMVLDPFAGSGTTAQAARNLGFDCILMEQDPDYAKFLRQRFDLAAPEPDDLLHLLDVPQVSPTRRTADLESLL